MPRTSLTAGAHRDDSRPDKFPQVKLERGEGRRLWVPDENIAFMEYRHSIQAPVFDETGQPLKTEKKVRGSVRTVYDMSYETGGYIGGPICLGSPETVQREKLDPDGCPACAGVKRLLDAGITDAMDLRPLPRYALPVVQYATLSKTDITKLRNPPNADILIWALSQWSWAQVDGIRGDMAEILGIEDLQKVKLQMCDILISNENGFQKIDKIRPAKRAWAHDSDFGREIRAVVQKLWLNAENRPTDEQLQAACGRPVDWMLVDQDIRDAEERWHRAENWGKGGPADSSAGGYLSNGQQAASLDDGLGLLDDLPPAGDPLADHPGGLDEFADRSQRKAPADDGDIFGPSESAPARAAAGDGDIFDDAPPAPSKPARDLGEDPSPGDDLLGGDPVPAGAAANGADRNGLATFEQIIDGAKIA